MSSIIMINKLHHAYMVAIREIDQNGRGGQDTSDQIPAFGSDSRKGEDAVSVVQPVVGFTESKAIVEKSKFSAM